MQAKSRLVGELFCPLEKVHIAQVLTYLRLADLHVGLLFNFNVEVLAVGGFKRVLGRE